MKPCSVAVLLGLLLLAGCRPAVAARVGDEAITTDDVQAEIDTMRGNAAYASHLASSTGRDPLGDGRSLAAFGLDVLTVQITTRLLEREAERTRLRLTADDRAAGALDASAATGRPSIIAAFPAAYRAALERRATLRVALRRTLVDDQTPDRYYARNTDEFVRPCTRHILVRTSDAADIARRRIVGGERFADVARDVSIDAGSVPTGGDLGCNGRRDLQPALNRAALTQDIGRVGRPIRTEDGYHLLLVTSRDVPPLDEIRGEVRGAVGRLAEARLATLLRDRAADAPVWVSPDIGRWDGERVVPR